MDIKFRCSTCNAKVGADGDMSGTYVRCPRCETKMRVPFAKLETGTEIGGFVIEKSLGGGAMGEVFLANQVAMDRKVALKVLSPQLTSDTEYIERFLKEVRLLGQLSHPNIVTAFEAGKDGGHHYLAMAYVEGEDLESILERDGALSEEDSLRVGAKIANALDHAWTEMQVLHRDVKPANIMIDKKNEARLMDLGISKQMNDNQSLTLTGMAVGTPHYMSPEQAQGLSKMDCRTDIFSLGATMYHLVAGDVPFDGENTMQILTQVVTVDCPPIREEHPEVSEDMEALIEKMMARDPEDRYQTWKEVRADIKKIRTGKHLHRDVKIQQKAQEAVQPKSKSPLFYILATVAVGLLLAVIIILAMAIKG